MAKRVNNLDNTVVTAQVIGQIIGVTDRRVRQLADEGVIPKLKNGSYDLVPTINSYIRNIKIGNEADADSSKSNYDQERYLHEKAKRKKAELILGEMKGQLHDSETVEEVMTSMLSNLRSKLLAIPSKTAPLLIGIDDIPEIQEILDIKIYESLLELSDYEPSIFRTDKYIAERDEDLEQDGKTIQPNS